MVPRARPLLQTFRCAGLALLFLMPAGCEGATREAPGTEAAHARVVIGGEPFELELALDPRTRYRGLSGRASIDPHDGMLFAFPRVGRLRFVMRDCAVPIDVAFLDAEGRIVALHEMRPEPPRGSDESPAAYEARLRRYSSGFAAQFAIELAGGRLRELGVAPGQRVAFDRETLAGRAR